MKFRTISQFILNFFVLVIRQCSSEGNLAQIFILEMHTDSENILAGQTTAEKISYLVRENSIVKFQCVSNAPLCWDVKMFNIPSDGFHIENERKFENFEDDKSYQYLSTVTIKAMTKHTIGKFTCQNVNDTSIYETLSLFLFDNNEPFYINEGNSLEIQHIQSDAQLILPCLVSRPSDIFYLISMNGWTVQRVEAEFNPQLGFVIDKEKFQNRVDGNYKCVIEGQEKDETHVSLTVISSNYIHYPPSSLVFTKNTLTVKCSAHYPVLLELEQDNDLIKHEVVYEVLPHNPFHFAATLNYKIDHDYMDKSGTDGTVRCLRSNKALIHQWKYRVMEEDHGLSFDLKNNEIVCKSTIDGQFPVISTRYCQNLELCQLMKKYHDKKDYQPMKSDNLEPSECGYQCLQINGRDLYMPGAYLISCVIDNFKEVETIFVDLDNILYTNTEDIPHGSLIRMKNDSLVINEQVGSITAACEAVSFHFSNFIHWRLDFANGFKLYISKELAISSENDGILHSKFEYITDLNEVVNVNCFTGFRSSSKWAIASWNLFRKSRGYTETISKKPENITRKTSEIEMDALNVEEVVLPLFQFCFSEQFLTSIKMYLAIIIDQGPKYFCMFVSLLFTNMLAIYIMDYLRSPRSQIKMISEETEDRSENNMNMKLRWDENVYSDDENETCVNKPKTTVSRRIKSVNNDLSNT